MMFAAAAERSHSRDSHPLAFLGLGAMLGLMSAAVVSVVRLIAGLPVEFGGTFGWWALVGIGFALIAEGRGHSLWRPVAAVVIAIAIVLCFAIFRPDSWGKSTPAGGALEPQRGNIFTTILGGVGYAVDKSLRNPDLPSRVWIDAKAEIDAHKAVQAAVAGVAGEKHSADVKPAKSEWGSVVARWCGCDEQSEATQAVIPDLEAPLQRALPTSPILAPIATRPSATNPAGDDPPRGSLAARILRGQSGPTTARLAPPTTQGGSTRGLVESTLSDADRAALVRFSQSTLSNIDWQSHLNAAKAVIKDDYSRQKVLCAELRQGLASGMVRSWIVMLLFAIGLGLAPMAEEKLRPIDYPSSRTRRNDRILAILLAVLVIGGAVVVRFTSGEILMHADRADAAVAPRAPHLLDVPASALDLAGRSPATGGAVALSGAVKPGVAGTGQGPGA
jgi:hypothetical protein